MDAENLRTTYNRNFQENKIIWTQTNIEKCNKTIKFVLNKVKYLLINNSNLKALDVGCALGYYTEAFRLNGFDATGLDYSEIAIKKSKASFPKCSFIHMDGFNPNLESKYDVIFIKGFSASNTHDINFVCDIINKYSECLVSKGLLIYSYSSDFSGKEKAGETANWTKKEIDLFISKLNLTKKKYFLINYYGILSKTLKKILRKVNKLSKKENYYIVFQK